MIFLASDHGGFELKESLKCFFKKENIEFVDVGCSDNKKCDYPIYAKKAIDKMLKSEDNKSILCCGSGVGMCIYANRFKKIYAVNGTSVALTKKAREHNNVNVLCLGGRFLKLNLAKKIVKTFLTTQYLEGHYNKRIEQIDK